MRKCVSVLGYAAALASMAVPASSAEYMEKSQQMATRAYSPGVITDGGRIVWLAGQTGFRDEQGKEMVGFDAQARQAFRGINAVLNRAGGTKPTWFSFTCSSMIRAMAIVSWPSGERCFLMAIFPPAH